MKRAMLLTGFMVICITVLWSYGDQNVSMKVTLDGEEIISCRKAKVRELFPENGGYRFDCLRDGSSLYVIYDTVNAPFKGAMKYIWFDEKHRKSGGKKLKTVYSWYYKLKDGKLQAPKVNSSGRKEKFKENMLGRIKHGSHEFNLSRPNRKIVFIITGPEL